MKKDTHNNFIKHGSLLIEEFKVILLSGTIDKVDEFLQGQVTSDHKKIINGGCQLSSICNHKGQVISDFFIIKSDNKYSFIIDKGLQDILIKELTPFAMLHRINLQKIDSSVIGHISPSKSSEHPYCGNDEFEATISIKDENYISNDSITYDNWQAANKLLGIFFMQLEDSSKYRPLEINYDNLRVSFDKGCYRGQEIVARMKYLGVDRRKFCTFVVQQNHQITNNIKVIGKIINLDTLRVFNAIVKRDEFDQINNDPEVISII